MIIFISGSINAGKTTVGRLLAKRLGYEFIDFDQLHELFPNFLLSKDLPKVFTEGIRRLSELNAAGKNVVVSYVIRQKDYKRLERELTMETHYFTLAPSIEVAKTDRGGRPLNEWELSRIDYHYRTGIAKPKFGTIIDNSKLTPKETVDSIIKELHAEAVNVSELKRQILRKPNSSELPIKLVAIDGHGGAGKSTLAEKLAKVLNAEVIHTDDFASWDNPYDWWPRLIKDVLAPIKQGAKSLSYGRSSWAPDHHPEPVKDQPVTPIMILEGVSSARREFRPYLSYAIWVETPIEVCLQRGLARDGQDALSQWQEWLAGENKYIEHDDPQSYANITVPGVPFIN